MVVQFRGSMAGLHVPLSTLHPHPCGRRYMTRSQCGSLLLHCMKLSLTTPCRLLPAHLNSEPFDGLTAGPLNVEQAQTSPFQAHASRLAPPASRKATVNKR